jgi:hypothetical protein
VHNTHKILGVQSGEDSYIGLLGYILPSSPKYKSYTEDGGSVFSKTLLPTYQMTQFYNLEHHSVQAQHVEIS